MNPAPSKNLKILKARLMEWGKKLNKKEGAG
jgi:hypothetical protein